MTDSQSTDLSSANAGAQVTHVPMVNTILPVPPEGTILPRQDQSLIGDSSASGSVANNPNLQKRRGLQN